MQNTRILASDEHHFPLIFGNISKRTNLAGKNTPANPPSLLSPTNRNESYSSLHHRMEKRTRQQPSQKRTQPQNKYFLRPKSGNIYLPIDY